MPVAKPSTVAKPNTPQGDKPQERITQERITQGAVSASQAPQTGVTADDALQGTDDAGGDGTGLTASEQAELAAMSQIGMKPMPTVAGRNAQFPDGLPVTPPDLPGYVAPPKKVIIQRTQAEQVDSEQSREKLKTAETQVVKPVINGKLPPRETENPNGRGVNQGSNANAPKRKPPEPVKVIKRDGAFMRGFGPGNTGTDNTGTDITQVTNEQANPDTLLPHAVTTKSEQEQPEQVSLTPDELTAGESKRQTGVIKQELLTQAYITDILTNTPQWAAGLITSSLAGQRRSSAERIAKMEIARINRILAAAGLSLRIEKPLDKATLRTIAEKHSLTDYLKDEAPKETVNA